MGIIVFAWGSSAAWSEICADKRDRNNLGSEVSRPSNVSLDVILAWLQWPTPVTIIVTSNCEKPGLWTIALILEQVVKKNC